MEITPRHKNQAESSSVHSLDSRGVLRATRGHYAIVGFGGRLTSDHITVRGHEKMANELAKINVLTQAACGTRPRSS
jgi:hypothetical protein